MFSRTLCLYLFLEVIGFELLLEQIELVRDTVIVQSVAELEYKSANNTWIDTSHYFEIGSCDPTSQDLATYCI